MTDLPDERRAIENKWIFKKKMDADGNVTIYKARLVAKGYRQVQGVDYDEIFSLVAMLKSVRIMLANCHILRNLANGCQNYIP